MSSTALNSAAGSSRDLFELERLAQELVTRESSRNVNGAPDELSPAERDLPIYVPLSHGNTYLTAETFNVEEFLLSRSYTSLPDLRSELRDYLATLKEELVRLINDDYEAFISLSTDLRGEGARLDKLQYPLGDLKTRVLEARQVLQSIQDAIQLRLNQRSALREEKAFLHLLLKISESITRLESLLLIASPEDKQANGTDSMSMPPREEDSAEDRTRANRAKHLSRVAAEYTQLLYHVSRAGTSTSRSAFVDDSQWRIDRIRSTLSTDLDHLFGTTLTSLISGKAQGREARASELEKQKWMADVAECLRTYDVLGLWRDAEEVLRREVVRPFVKKTIHPAALAAPHSPLLPHTPLPINSSVALPHTPHTPFTAFASKQNPFESTLLLPGQPAHALDQRDDPLASVYNAVLRFANRDLKRIMEVAEGICVKSGARRVGGVGDTELRRPKEREAFEVMANVVWAEVGRAVMDELGGVAFAVGKPDEFRKRYETTQAFIRALEFLAPSVQAIEAMRGHPVYAAFERRWQLPVYFQLRWKEIVAKLEETLTVTRLERVQSKAIEPFVTQQAFAVWEAIRTCWSAEVYIPELSHRFWKFTLQLLSRYRTWLGASLPAFEPPPKVAAAVAAERLAAPGTPPQLSRSSTPGPATEAASIETIAAEDMQLKQFATAVTDIKAMQAQIMKVWREELGAMLPEDADGDAAVTPEETLTQALEKLQSLVPPLTNQIVFILSRRGCDALLPMRSVPSQFRGTGKRMPTEPSYFVASIFKPLRAFFGIGSADGPGAALKDEMLAPVAGEVFEAVAQRYVHFLGAMKKTEESLRRLRKGKKTTFSFLGGGAAKEDDGRADEEKIRQQMILDVEAFGKDAQSLSVKVQVNDTFRTLESMAKANLTDDG